MSRLLLTSALFLVGFAGSLADDKKPADPFPVTDLPRVKPLGPAESARQFDVRPGFRVELVAAEPLVRSPVAMDFDENGRLYVAEFPEYNQYANPNPPKVRGRIVMLVEPIPINSARTHAHVEFEVEPQT